MFHVKKHNITQWRGSLADCWEYLVNVYGDCTVHDLVKVQGVVIVPAVCDDAE